MVKWPGYKASQQLICSSSTRTPRHSRRNSYSSQRGSMTDSSWSRTRSWSNTFQRLRRSRRSQSRFVLVDPGGVDPLELLHEIDRLTKVGQYQETWFTWQGPMYVGLGKEYPHHSPTLSRMRSLGRWRIDQIGCWIQPQDRPDIWATRGIPICLEVDSPVPSQLAWKQKKWRWS